MHKIGYYDIQSSKTSSLPAAYVAKITAFCLILFAQADLSFDAIGCAFQITREAKGG